MSPVSPVFHTKATVNKVKTLIHNITENRYRRASGPVRDLVVFFT